MAALTPQIKLRILQSLYDQEKQSTRELLKPCLLKWDLYFVSFILYHIIEENGGICQLKSTCMSLFFMYNINVVLCILYTESFLPLICA